MDETEHGPEEHNTHLTPNGDLSGILPNQDLAIDRSYPEGTRPKILSAGCASVLSSLGVDTENATAMEDIREEKIKKWKQAGGALRRVLSKITKNKNKNVYPNKVDKSNGNHGAAVNKESNNSHKGKSCKRGRPRAKAEGTEDSRNSQNDPMNEMLAEFKMNSADSGQGLDDSRPASVEHHAKSQDPPTPTSTRQLSTFAELKEKIRRMTSGSNSGGASKQSNAAPSNVTKKRHKILRHSKSQDSSEKRQSESTESESDDFRPQRQHKPITRHHSTKEKRKSIDNAAFSFLKCSLGPSLSQVGENGSRTQDSLDVSDAILSDGEIPPLKLKHSEPSSKQGLVLSNQSLPKGPLNRRTAELLKEADSFANLADVESEGELNGDDIIDASCEVHLQNVLKDANHSNSEESVHTLCSTSEEEQAAAGQIRDEKYAKKSSAARPLKANSWAIGDDGKILKISNVQFTSDLLCTFSVASYFVLAGSDDDSDLFDDLPDLRLHLPNTSSSDGDGSPILRISHADIDRLPSILSDVSRDPMNSLFEYSHQLFANIQLFMNC